MEQTNIRMKSLFKKDYNMRQLKKAKPCKDTIIDYLVLGISLERIMKQIIILNYQ